jgi:hypothetical protein
VQPFSMWVYSQTGKCGDEMWAVRLICTAAGFVDAFFGLTTGRDVCRQKLVIFSLFCLQTVGYGIGISAELVRQLSKLNSKQYRSSYTEKKWTGWDLNPRPQQYQVL